MMQMLNVESQLSSRNKKQKIVMVCCSWIHNQKELENKMFKRKYETNWIWDIKRKKKNLKTKDENLQKNETYLNF
jgi:formaldehyde-activating enzyme involved in methanogenesis